MQTDFINILIDRKDIALFKYLFEAYENLATVSTIDPQKAMLEIIIPEGNLGTVMDILRNMDEVRFTVTKKGTR